MLSSLRTCLSPFPSPSPLSPPHRTPTNPTNAILTVTCTSPCASLPLPFSPFILILFTLRSTLLSEIADDQPSRLAKSSLSLTHVLTHVISRFSFIFVYGLRVRS